MDFTLHLMCYNKANNINNNVNWREKIYIFLNVFTTDFVLVRDIPGELDLWERYWTKEFKGNLPTTASDTLDALNELNPFTCATVFEALKTKAVVSSTLCYCKRLISSLRRLKDYTQNTMKSDRLNGLASMYIHRDIGIVNWFRKVWNTIAIFILLLLFLWYWCCCIFCSSMFLFYVPII